MAQFVAFDKTVEVIGAGMPSWVEAAGAFKESMLEIMKQHGMTDIQPDHWYSQQVWLDICKSVADKVGYSFLFQVGKHVPENAIWPPEVKTIEQALASVDIAYHLNHRIHGEAAFDPATGKINKKIGCYLFEKVNDRQARMVCQNPYPCDFDRGLLTTISRKFKPANALFVKLEHDPSQPCRNQGGDSCTYLISW